jgi:L-threonylcarbamoyladenylate synthase
VVSAASDVRAPGLLASHYAPRAGLWLVTPQTLGDEATRRLEAGARVAALVSPEMLTPAGVTRFEVGGDDEAYARALYATLRAVDEQGLDVVLAVPPAGTGVGLAVLDRLRRAAAPRSG